MTHQLWPFVVDMRFIMPGVFDGTHKIVISLKAFGPRNLQRNTSIGFEIIEDFINLPLHFENIFVSYSFFSCSETLIVVQYEVENNRCVLSWALFETLYKI